MLADFTEENRAVSRKDSLFPRSSFRWTMREREREREMLADLDGQRSFSFVRNNEAGISPKLTMRIPGKRRVPRIFQRGDGTRCLLARTILPRA